jgi:hypothetical protein
LTLLTASKEPSIRKIRSYCASLGGSGQILESFDDWLMLKDHSGQKNILQVIIYDAQLNLAPQELDQLRSAGTLIVVDPPIDYSRNPRNQFFQWPQDYYCASHLELVFQSPVVRFFFAKKIIEHKEFSLAHLLRWGHALQKWDRESVEQIADLSQIFCRNLKLNGESRRLTEMSSHFMEVFPNQLKLALENLTFASDGITTGVIGELKLIDIDYQSSSLLEEISQYEFPITVINDLGAGKLEIGALFHAQTPMGKDHSRMFLNLWRNDPQTKRLTMPPIMRKQG